MTDEAMREHTRRQADSLRPSYDKLPGHIQGGMRVYIERGMIPGDFLRAVLSNKLAESFGQADEVNRARMYDIVGWLYNDAPGQSWGSEEKMKAWAAHCGLEGLDL